MTRLSLIFTAFFSDILYVLKIPGYTASVRAFLRQNIYISYEIQMNNSNT